MMLCFGISFRLLLPFTRLIIYLRYSTFSHIMFAVILHSTSEVKNLITQVIYRLTFPFSVNTRIRFYYYYMRIWHYHYRTFSVPEIHLGSLFIVFQLLLLNSSRIFFNYILLLYYYKNAFSISGIDYLKFISIMNIMNFEAPLVLTM